MSFLTIFTDFSKYKKVARFIATLWTLTIFVLCLLPGDDLPNVDIPFVDKWAHLILFGAFSIFWMAAYPTRNPRFLLILLALNIFVGWLVEFIQDTFTRGRFQDNWDTIADVTGGIIGIGLFVIMSLLADKRLNKLP